MTNHLGNRQGDVLILRLAAQSPRTGNPLPRDGRGRIVLAAGEATGHHHAIADKCATLATIDDVDARFVQIMTESGMAQIALEPGDRILTASESVTVEHEEHGSHTLDRGSYLVRMPLEFVAPEIVRRVVD